MICLLGHNGSMGRRYQAILKSLGQEFKGIDINDDYNQIHLDYTHYIVATPTNTHYRIVKDLIPKKKPILCEKPISKNLDEVKDLYRKANGRLTMTLQYACLPQEPTDTGESVYNYYNHGQDGLYWDCLQIVTLARGDVFLGENKPFWTCSLNGRRFELGQMDYAYHDFVKLWLDGKIGGPNMNDTVIRGHEKVAEMIGGSKK